MLLLFSSFRYSTNYLDLLCGTLTLIALLVVGFSWNLALYHKEKANFFLILAAKANELEKEFQIKLAKASKSQKIYLLKW